MKLDPHEKKLVAMGLLLLKDLLCQKKDADKYKVTLQIVQLVNKMDLDKAWGEACADIPPVEIAKRQ
jgi:hypothetical protein